MKLKRCSILKEGVSAPRKVETFQVRRLPRVSGSADINVYAVSLEEPNNLCYYYMMNIIRRKTT